MIIALLLTRTCSIATLFAIGEVALKQIRMRNEGERSF